MAKEKEVDNKLQNVLDKLDKIYGKGTLMRMSDKPKIDYDVISTGSIQLDAAIGIGGLPKGRIVEIFGPESSGKTTLAIHLMAEAQKLGNNVGFIDAEYAFDLKYAKNLGVDVNSLFINQPSSGEQALEILHAMVESGQFGVIVVDSVAALTPQKEIDGEIGDAHMGLLARLMGQAMRKLTSSISTSNTLVIFINQVRDIIGGMSFGPTTTTPGGRALRFASSIRMEIKRIGSEKSGDEITANKTKVKIVKNKMAPPFIEAEFNILFGVGIDKFCEIIELAVENNILKKAGGGWFSYIEQNGDITKLGQGIENLKETLNDNPELYETIKNRVKELFN